MPSYRALIQKPAWYLLDTNGDLVASVRADTAYGARDKLKLAGLNGARVVRGATWKGSTQKPEISSTSPDEPIFPTCASS